ncbi:MAG: hypothetical protein JWR18_2797, partial [Segetibacter sp.]|nr:hypothetical protein [Segetibacter sp.]
PWGGYPDFQKVTENNDLMIYQLF